MRAILGLLLTTACATVPPPGMHRAVMAHEGFVFGVALRPGRDQLFSCGRDKLLVRYVFPEMRPDASTRTATEFTSIAATRDWVATSEASGDVALWNPDTLECARRVRAHADMAYSVAFGSGLLASAGFDGAIRLWSVPDLREQRAFATGAKGVLAVLFLGDRRLASAQSDGTLSVWDLRTGTRSNASAHDGVVGALAYGGGRLFSCGWDGRVAAFDESLRSLARLQAHEEALDAIAVSPDGRWVFSGDWSGLVIQWDARTRAEIRRWRAHV